jgi:hypothetical protein
LKRYLSALPYANRIVFPTFSKECSPASDHNV